MATPANHLFTVPIGPLDNHPGGAVVCTEPSPKVYLLTFTSPPDNRLTHHFVGAMMTALDIVEARYPPGVVVTTSGIPKFYSNGLDLGLASSMPRFFETQMYALLRRFLSYPMPTIALVNGHAFAGGFMLAMHHDYRVFSGPKGYMCVNEVEFGAPIPLPLLNIYKLKARPQVVRDTVLEAKRWTAQTALEAGLVESTEGWEGVQKLVKDRGLLKKGTTGVYRALKKGLYGEQLAMLSSAGDEVVNAGIMMKEEEADKKAAKARASAAKL